MKYPSNFVLVTADMEAEVVSRNPGLGPILQQPHISSLSPPPSPLAEPTIKVL